MDWRVTPKPLGLAVERFDHPLGEVHVHPTLLLTLVERARRDDDEQVVEPQLLGRDEFDAALALVRLATTESERPSPGRRSGRGSRVSAGATESAA